jgi:hypothetical protein
VAFYVIDRIERETAVVVAEDGRAFDVARRTTLPPGCREGTVLRIDGPAGEPPDWGRAVIDDEERARRLARARETLRGLGESDPGGDVTL